MIDFYEVTRSASWLGNGTRIIERKQYPSLQAALAAFHSSLVLGDNDDGSRIVRLLSVEGEQFKTLIKAEVNLR